MKYTKEKLVFVLIILSLLAVPVKAGINDVGSAWVSPASQSVNSGSSVIVTIGANSAVDVFGVDMELEFDSSRLSIAADDIVPLLDGWTFGVKTVVNNKITLIGFHPNFVPITPGSVDIATLTFQSIEEGEATLTLTKMALGDPNPITDLESAIITVSTLECVPATVEYGSVGSPPTCAITCDDGYHLVGTTCVGDVDGTIGERIDAGLTEEEKTEKIWSLTLISRIADILRGWFTD